VSKQWIGNICASVLKGIFTDWIRDQVDARNEKLLVERGLAIEMDSQIVKAFRASTKTSGSYHLIFHQLTISFINSSTRLRCAHVKGWFEKATNQG